MRALHTGIPCAEMALRTGRLETEGFALRGRFTPNAAADEWCERRLLARIHQYTVKRLRAEIEPVARAIFSASSGLAARGGRDANGRSARRSMRSWPSSKASRRPRGPGKGDPADPPRRVRASWLDDRRLAGRIAWARFKTAQRADKWH